MCIKKFLALTIVLAISSFGVCSQSKGTIENEKHTVNVRIESGELKISVRNRLSGKNISLRGKAGFVDNITKMFFLDTDSFVTEGYFGAGRAILIAYIKEVKLDIREFRMSDYVISPEKTKLVYSNWCVPTQGPTYLALLDLKNLADGKSLRDRGKVIFETRKFQRKGERLTVSPHFIIWDDMGKNVFFKTARGAEYAFRYDLIADRTTMIQKLDRHNPKSVIRFLKWVGEDKVLEIGYSEKVSGEKYIYRIPVKE